MNGRKNSPSRMLNEARVDHLSLPRPDNSGEVYPSVAFIRVPVRWRTSLDLEASSPYDYYYHCLLALVFFILIAIASSFSTPLQGWWSLSLATQKLFFFFFYLLINVCWFSWKSVVCHGKNRWSVVPWRRRKNNYNNVFTVNVLYIHCLILSKRSRWGGSEG